VSAARCQDNIVVGFGDTEAGNNNSFAGYSVSADDGKTFRDLGVLPVSTADSGFGQDQIGGRGNSNAPNSQGPSLGCANAGQVFYYADTAIQPGRDLANATTCDTRAGRLQRFG
jgi:hypothetical protein